MMTDDKVIDINVDEERMMMGMIIRDNDDDW